MRHKCPLRGLRIWIVLAPLISLTVQARELSLEQALELAVQHSHRLKNAKAERKASGSALRSTKAARLPTLSVKAFAFYKDEVPSFDITLPPNPTISREVGSKENYQTDLRVSVPLFTGGRIGGSIQAANATFDLYRALEGARLDELLYQTRIEYLSLYRADRLLDAARASLERATIMRNDVRSLFAGGAADSVDLLESDIALADADFKVKQALSRRRSANIRLVTLLGLPAKDSVVILDKLPWPRAIEAMVLDESKPELQAAMAAVAAGRAQVRLARSAYLPTVSLYGGYSYGKPNLDLFNKMWMDYFSVGADLTWSFEIGGKNRHQLQRAKHLYRAARQERDEVAERLDREAELALESLTLAYHRHQTARFTYTKSSDNYRLAVERHRQGVLSSNRLLELEAALSEAEAARAATLVDFYIAQSAYYFSIGWGQLREGF